MKPITWSYSSLSLYQQCPKKYYHLKVAKDIKEELGEAIVFGNEIHKIAEEYVAKDKPIPEKYKGIEPALKALKDMEGEKLCENKLGLTVDFEPCGFFDKKVWWRGVADIIILQGDTILTVDYKTGKKSSTQTSSNLRFLRWRCSSITPKSNASRQDCCSCSPMTSSRLFTQPMRNLRCGPTGYQMLGN